MEKVTNYLTGFFGGLMSIMMAIIPVTILWYVLTGGDVWGMDIITNLTNLINTFGTGGFTGLVVLLLVAGFFEGLMAVMMAILPVTILWYILTGGDVWGMDVIANLTVLINNFGTGGFTGLVVLMLVAGLFVKK